jgi:hypothetical protein
MAATKVHTAARTRVYKDGTVRSDVPDSLVPWEVTFPEYKPVRVSSRTPPLCERCGYPIFLSFTFSKVEVNRGKAGSDDISSIGSVNQVVFFFF